MTEQGRNGQEITFPDTEGEGTDGRGSPGIIDEKNREAEAAEADPAAMDFDGDDTDGAGSTGMLDEQIRPARAGETDTTRFGMLQEGADSDGQGTGGMVDKNDAGGPLGTAADATADLGATGGLASSLQAGGTIPGGGPGTMHGSLGSGGGSNTDEETGTLRSWDDGEHQESKG